MMEDGGMIQPSPHLLPSSSTRMNRILAILTPLDLKDYDVIRLTKDTNLNTQEAIFEDKVEPYRYQVAGHPRTFYLSLLTRKYVYKITSIQEIYFYCSINKITQLGALKKHIPEFSGVYHLSNGVATLFDPVCNNLKSSLDTIPPVASIRLENLLFGISNPNYADLKLGSVLYCCCASEQKRDKMIQRSEETTSHSTCIRVSGFCKWNPTTNSYEEFTKIQGYLLTENTIFSALENFFTITGDTRPRYIVLSKVLKSLLFLRNTFLSTDVMLRSTSLFIAYSNNPSNSDTQVVVKVIDFARSHVSGRSKYGDGGFLLGLNNLINFLELQITKPPY